MSIYDAIIALSPALYWPLQETSGTTAFSAVGSNHATISGDLTLGVTGPELNTTAFRIFSTGQLLSQLQMGFGSASDVTIMFWASMSGSNPTGQNQTLVNIGDPANPTARGFRVFEQHAVIGQPAMGAAINVGSQATQGFGYPVTFWHLWTAALTAATKNIKIWADTTTTNVTPVGTWQFYQSADPLQVRSNVPLVIAHVAVFQRIVSDTEVANVASNIAQWPYTLPINYPISTTTTSVDLTPVLNNQSTYMPQITAIENNQSTFMPQIANTQTIVEWIQGQWNGYTSVTLPSLNDKLQSILDGLTTTITGVGGAVAKTVGDLFSGKTLDLLTTQDLGTVCAPDDLDVTLSGGVFFGIQATCTSFADWYVFTGPGDTYVTQSLGTLEITRGGSTELRHGLHTTTYTVYPLPGAPNFLLDVGLPNVPLDYHVSLVPAPETCWHLVGLTMP